MGSGTATALAAPLADDAQPGRQEALASLAASRGAWFGAGEVRFDEGTVQWDPSEPAVPVSPSAPCFVVSTGDGGSRLRGWWSDGRRALAGDVAVTLGDAVWTCATTGRLERHTRVGCQAWTWSPPESGVGAAWLPATDPCWGELGAPMGSHGEPVPPAPWRGAWGTEVFQRDPAPPPAPDPVEARPPSFRTARLDLPAEIPGEPGLLARAPVPVGWSEAGPGHWQSPDGRGQFWVRLAPGGPDLATWARQAFESERSVMPGAKVEWLRGELLAPGAFVAEWRFSAFGGPPMVRSEVRRHEVGWPSAVVCALQAPWPATGWVAAAVDACVALQAAPAPPGRRPGGG
jgi:hypothetical protein